MFERATGAVAAPPRSAGWFEDLAALPPRPKRQATGTAEEFCEGLKGPRQRPGAGEPAWGASVRDQAAESRAAEPGWGATVGGEAADSPGWGPTVGDRPLPVSPEVAALQAAIEAVAAVDPRTVDPAQALVDARAVLAMTDTLKLTAMRRVADVEDRRLHRMDGAPTTNSWLRQHDSDLSAAQVTLARRLPKLPTLSEAVQERSISTAAAAKIATQLSKLRPWVGRPDGLIDGQPAVQTLHAVIVDGVRGQVCQALGGLADDDPRLIALMAQLAEIEQRPESEIARLEAAFVLLAQSIEPDLLPGALATLVDALLPNEFERRAADAHANRGFDVRPDFDGGGWHVTDGDWDLELGELWHTVLTAMRAVDPDNPVDTDGYRTARQDGWTSADGGDGLDGLDSDRRPAPRSRRQQQHDALKNALRLLLDSGILGQRDKVAPHIGVTTGLDTMHGAPGAAPAVGDSGARLPRSLVQKWWCDSSVTRFVLGLGRKVIETSHTERTLKAHERRAKRIETGGRCQTAGCRCGPGTKLIPHHPDAWARSGITSYDDTVMLCEPNHTHIHTGGNLRLRDGRLLGPDGWIKE